MVEAGTEKDGYLLPAYPIVPAIYLIGIVGMLILRAYYETEKSIQDLAFVLTGIPVYFLFFRNR